MGKLGAENYLTVFCQYCAAFNAFFYREIVAVVVLDLSPVSRVCGSDRVRIYDSRSVIVVFCGIRYGHALGDRQCGVRSAGYAGADLSSRSCQKARYGSSGCQKR